MKLFTLLLFALFNSIAFSQAQALLNVNDVKANFLSNGILGHNPGNASASFEVPQGGGAHTLYAAAPWFGGIDAMGQLQTACELYGQSGIGFWPGTLGTNGNITAASSASWDQIFAITRVEVDAFIATGTITGNIANWPAHGDVSLGEDFYLAPFVDVDSDGQYDPSQGDYPCFTGDQALYFIFNDRANGNGIGIEFRCMAYAYATGNAALNQTVFLHYEIKNQSTQSLSDSYLGLFTDFDLGNYDDDYIGSDVERGLSYVWNGDENDQSGATQGYGSSPPAFGLSVLQGVRMDSNGVDDGQDNLLPSINGENFGDGIMDNERHGMSSTAFFNGFFSATSVPSSSVEYYNYLQGLWKDGSTRVYGGSGHTNGGGNPNQPAPFFFPGTSDPLGASTGGNVQAPWGETSLMNFPGDRRGMAAMGPFTFDSGEQVDVDFAFSFARSSQGAQASVGALQLRTDSVRDFFRNNVEHSDLVTSPCGSIANSVLAHNHAVSIEVYPIPASETITVSVSSKTHAIRELSIHDLTGKLVLSHPLLRSKTEISISNLERGVYLLSIPNANGIAVHRFVKE